MQCPENEPTENAILAFLNYVGNLLGLTDLVFGDRRRRGQKAVGTEGGPADRKLCLLKFDYLECYRRKTR